MVKLAKREKYLVSFAACAIGMFLLLQFLIFPFFEERKRIQRGIKAREEGLEEIVRLRAEYLLVLAICLFFMTPLSLKNCNLLFRRVCDQRMISCA